MNARGGRQWGPVPVPAMLRREAAGEPAPWATVLERLREAVATGDLTRAACTAENSANAASLDSPAVACAKYG
jgi:hypothetical protein